MRLRSSYETKKLLPLPKVSPAYWIGLLSYVTLLLIYLLMIVVFAMGGSTTAEFPPMVILFVVIIVIHILLLGIFPFIKQTKETLGIGVLNLILLAISFIATSLNMLKMELDITGLLLHGTIMVSGIVLAVETFIKIKAIISSRTE